MTEPAHKRDFQVRSLADDMPMTEPEIKVRRYLLRSAEIGNQLSETRLDIFADMLRSGEASLLDFFAAGLGWRYTAEVARRASANDTNGTDRTKTVVRVARRRRQQDPPHAGP